MKKKKVNNNKTSTASHVIRAIFQVELKNFESNIDNKFVAFEKRVDQKFDAFEVKIELKLDDLERKVDEKAQQYRDQILTSNDKLMKRLETMEQESVVGNFQRDEKLEDHEKRIKILESA